MARRNDSDTFGAAFDQSRLVWPPPIALARRHGNPCDGNSDADCGCLTNRYSDASRCGYAGGGNPDTRADSNCHFLTDRHAATNGRTHCYSNSVRDTRRESDHAALKGGASAIRTACDQSRFLRPPTRFATRYGSHSNGGGYARCNGHPRGQRDVCRRIDGRRRDRPTDARGSTNRIGETACVRNGSARIIVGADYSAGSQLADSLSARCPAIASSHIADGRRDSGLRRHESVSERSGVGDVKLIQLVGDRVEIAS